MKELLPSITPRDFSLNLIQEIPNQIALHFEDIRPEKVRSFIFANHGWRLSATGFSFLSLYYTYYTYSSDFKLTGKIILGMDRSIKGPWFIRGKQVSFFDQNTYFELSMFNGDLDKFVDFKQ